MYKCNCCGEEFSVPKTVYDYVPYGEGFEKAPAGSVCPCCQSPFFEKADNICELCGDVYEDSVHEDVCPSCINIVAKRFSDMLKENFTPFEISVLNSAYDGRDLG